MLDESQQRRFLKRKKIITKSMIVLFFITIGPALGLISFVFGFFVEKMLRLPNLERPEFFSTESLSLVYIAGFIPALIVGISSCRTAEPDGRFSLKRAMISGTLIGALLSSPFLFFGYDIPPHTISERLPTAVMIVWVNIGAATLSWVVWELLRRGAMMTSKRQEA